MYIPLAARPIAQGIIFNNDKKAYDAFLKERKKEVSKLILTYITM